MSTKAFPSHCWLIRSHISPEFVYWDSESNFSSQVVLTSKKFGHERMLNLWKEAKSLQIHLPKGFQNFQSRNTSAFPRWFTVDANIGKWPGCFSWLSVFLHCIEDEHSRFSVSWLQVLNSYFHMLNYHAPFLTKQSAATWSRSTSHKEHRWIVTHSLSRADQPDPPYFLSISVLYSLVSCPNYGISTVFAAAISPAQAFGALFLLFSH